MKVLRNTLAVILILGIMPVSSAYAFTSVLFPGYTGNGGALSFLYPTASTYTIVASSSQGGSISPEGRISVARYGSKTFTITPTGTNQISEVFVDGISVGRVSSYTFNRVTANHSIEARFFTDAPPYAYSIDASAGLGGRIQPSGRIWAEHWTTQTFAITPIGAYQISDVIVDGVSVGPVSTYSFRNIAKPHTIQAKFKLGSFYPSSSSILSNFFVTSSADVGGDINPSGDVSVSQGNSQTFMITPSAGYTLADVIIDGKSVGPVKLFTFSSVSGDHSINAVFQPGTAASVTVSPGYGTVGGKITVPVVLNTVGENGASPDSLSVDVMYDATLLGNPEVVIGPAGNAAMKALSFSEVTPGLLRMNLASAPEEAEGPSAWYQTFMKDQDGGGKVIEDGVAAYVTFDVNADAQPGTYDIMSAASASDASGSTVRIDDSYSTVSVFSGLVGDCDGADGVDGFELNTALEMFLDITAVESCVDANGDGYVSIDEVQLVVNNYAGGDASEALAVTGENTGELPKITVGASSGVAEDGAITFPVYFQGSGGYTISSVAFDIWFDQSVLSEPTAVIDEVGTAAGKGLLYNVVTPGVLRVGVVSENLTPFGNGALATIKFQTTGAMPEGLTLQIEPWASDPFGNEMPVEGVDGGMQAAASDDVPASVGGAQVDVTWMEYKVAPSTETGKYAVTGKVSIVNNGDDLSPRNGALKLFTSTDDVLDDGDALNKEMTVYGLDPGKAVSMGFFFETELPTALSKVYLLAAVENMNGISAASAQEVAGGVDLTAHWSGLTLSGPDSDGSYRVLGSYSLINNGSLPTTPFNVQVFFSTDAALDSWDKPLLSDAQTILSLDAGESRTRSFSTNLDQDPKGGYLIVKVDSGDAIEELDEGNNEIENTI